MKNYLVIGEKWVRAIVFADDAGVERFIDKNCAGIAYQRYSEAEFNEIYADADIREMEYSINEYMARYLIIICRDGLGNRLSDC